ncbi:transposase [Rhizobium gallicum]|uniref:transposase n=1 Tax=Rhizobium gallicum TaxID=56730 RepID=UPI001EF75D7C|nr:transposase [Rhizobium gallicum]ULJ75443.1 transposase [Rhizobium gallicum]
MDRESRESQASFRCCQCGLRAHADHNAAINILRRNTASMIVEEGQPLSVEAITIGGASRPLQAGEDVNEVLRSVPRSSGLVAAMRPLALCLVSSLDENYS